MTPKIDKFWKISIFQALTFDYLWTELLSEQFSRVLLRKFPLPKKFVKDTLFELGISHEGERGVWGHFCMFWLCESISYLWTAPFYSMKIFALRKINWALNGSCQILYIDTYKFVCQNLMLSSILSTHYYLPSIKF